MVPLYQIEFLTENRDGINATIISTNFKSSPSQANQSLESIRINLN